MGCKTFVFKSHFKVETSLTTFQQTSHLRTHPTVSQRRDVSAARLHIGKWSERAGRLSANPRFVARRADALKTTTTTTTKARRKKQRQEDRRRREADWTTANCGKRSQGTTVVRWFA
ncbi:hypothetical protein SRHO_G00202960 [Serrasalmus rhombeus]